MQGFTNSETAKLFAPAENFNWNRRIQIPGVWSGHVKDIPPHAVDALIKQGRKDFVAQSAKADPVKATVAAKS